jgi:succinate dehydrogenase / fumarate reductase iron-sulfur subunit
MSEFTLPANSKVKPGKHWPAPQHAQRVKSFRVYRWDPDDRENPTIDTFDIDREHCGPMVLDALVKINDEIDPSLAFRRSCREGVCGSCAMNIDETNTLACLTPMDSLKKGISRITPLPHMPVLKDLIPDLSGLYAQYELIEPWVQSDQPPPDRERRQSPEDRAKLDGMWECILCFCCSTSCPSYWWNQDKYLGPSILLQSRSEPGSSACAVSRTASIRMLSSTRRLMPWRQVTARLRASFVRSCLNRSWRTK